AVFQEIVANVVEAVQIPCQLEIPELPADVALGAIDVVFTKGDGTSATWKQVSSEAACEPGAFFVDDGPPATIHLCSAACALAESDDASSLAVKTPCGGVVR